MVAYSVWKPLIFSGYCLLECFGLIKLTFKQEGNWQVLSTGGCHVA